MLCNCIISEKINVLSITYATCACKLSAAAFSRDSLLFGDRMAGFEQRHCQLHRSGAQTSSDCRFHARSTPNSPSHVSPALQRTYALCKCKQARSTHLTTARWSWLLNASAMPLIGSNAMALQQHQLFSSSLQPTHLSPHFARAPVKICVNL